MELLKEGGAAALDLRKVARKAGVSHTAPYRHFDDKRALLAAIAEEGFVRLTAQMQEAVSSAGTMFPLLEVGRAYVNFALTEPALMREMFSGLTIDRMAYPSLHEASKSALAVLVQDVEREQRAGSVIQDEDATNLALVLWAMFHGLAMLLLENQMPMIGSEPSAIEEMVRRCVAGVYEGIRPR
jgi:AcrR family transcriptional regulator